MSKEITVVLMTYNHINYIKQALDSILSQIIDIDFNILVHDDCSNDGTYELLLKYQKQFPNKIEIIRQTKRRFLDDGFNMLLYKYVAPRIESRFVAYCDGDDYWIDRFKLKKQFLFMTNNPDYSLCFHSAYQLRIDNDLTSKWFIRSESDFTLSDFINDKPGVCVATSSIFIRSDVFKDFPNWRQKYPVEDVPMYIAAAISGRIHCLADIMCVYRQFAFGSWSSQNHNNTNRLIGHQENMKNAIQLFDCETNFAYHDLVIKEIEGHDFMIALLKKDYKTVFLKQNKRFVKRLPFKERLVLRIEYKHPKFYKMFH